MRLFFLNIVILFICSSDFGICLFNFAKLISKNSKTQTILVKNQKELSNYLKKNLIADEIIIGMGAGSISQWMRELKFSL